MWDGSNGSLGRSTGPSGYPQSVGSADDRHNARHTSRGPARPGHQLGRIELGVLQWLRDQEATIRFEAREARLLEDGVLRYDVAATPEQTRKWCAKARAAHEKLEVYGVPWIKVYHHIGESSGDTSTALKSLERRGLVVVHRPGKRRVSHARLLPQGWRAASLAPLTEAKMREVFVRACERRFGPRSDWTSQQRKAFEHDFHALLGELEAPPGTLPLR